MTGQRRITIISKADVFLRMLFPPRCVLCDELLSVTEQEEGIHVGCRGKLPVLREPLCMQCGRPVAFPEEEFCYDCAIKRRRESYVPVIRQGKALYGYHGRMKQAMYRLKYANRREYASFFAREAYRVWGAWMKRCGIEGITAVPMYEGKRKKRGYNQAELIARRLAKIMDLPFLDGIVIRIRDTRAQKELDNRERKNNLKNAFQKQKNIVQYTCVLLVDDIYTTGNTVEAVAEELYRAGIKEIYTLAVCIGEGI